MNKILFIFTLLFFTNANAYVDPGMGPAFMQLIIAIVGAVAFYISYTVGLIKKLVNKIKSFFTKKKTNEKM